MVSEKLDRMYSEIRDSVNREEKLTDKIEKLVESHFHFVENNVDFCDLLIRGEGLTLSDKGTILRDKLIADYFNHIGFVESIMRFGMETRTLKSWGSAHDGLHTLGHHPVILLLLDAYKSGCTFE